MPRIEAIDPKAAQGKTKQLFEAVGQKLGRVPNLFRTLGNSPAALQAYLDFGATLAGGALRPQLRELIAVAVAESNSCQYCLSAHTAVGKMVGISDPELAAGRQGDSTDPKTRAALMFAKNIVSRRGFVADGDLAAVREAGWTETEVVEIVANVALNLFSNYFNHIAQTDVDFPTVETPVV